MQNWGASVKEWVGATSDYQSLLDTIAPYSSKNRGNIDSLPPYNPPSSPPSSTPRPSSTGGGSSSADTQAQREAEQAQRAAEQAQKEAEKAAEEQYKNNLARFTDYINETERLEKRWVDKQKELGQLSNKDFLYITQQRITRYQSYLDELAKMTWINAEDRAKLEKEYTEEIEDLQLDYLGYLKDILEEETKEIEDARDEKIKAIEDEADARINALRKVEDENDRIRNKEDYESKRRSIQEEIDYWSQRTGREAQENLLDAQKQLQELDKDWDRTLEDWTLEDQIQEIEDARDKEIEALEEAAQKEIDELHRVYDEKVRVFSETGQIIYENGIIESNNLYNAYKENFLDRIRADLESIRSATEQATPPPPQPSAPAQSTPQQKQQYETYTIKWGDTLTSIARKFGTTIEKILEANPYITNRNKIYAGKTLQIPKFHEGGETIGLREGWALLKPHEIVLKPDWAAGVKKLANMVQRGNLNTNSQVINIKGNLMNMEANIANKSDADYIIKKAVREVQNKLNIKK